MAGDAGSSSPPAPTRSTGRHSRGPRWAGAAVLLIIAAALVPATLVARFARGEVLDTDRYVATVAPLASDPAVQGALTNRITTEILSRINVSALIDQASNELNLKAGAQIGALVSGPITEWLTSFVHQKVQQFVSSQTFANLWVQVNRLAHRSVEVVLTGRQGGVLSTHGNSIVLEIGPIVEAAKSALVAAGFTLASKVPTINAQFTLLQTDQLPRAQRYVRWLDALANWLPWIMLLCFTLAVWVAPGRRRAALIGVLFAVVLLAGLLIANQVARNAYQDQLSMNGRDVQAGTVVYDSVLRFLISAVVTALATLAVVAVWLWLAGPGRVGSALRGLAGRGFAWIAGRLGWPYRGVVAAVDRYHPWAYLGLGLLAFFLLLRFPQPATVVWMAVVALVLTAAVAVLHRCRAPAPAAVSR